MLRLDIPREPRWVAVGCGVDLLVKPASAALITTARLRAARQLREMRDAVQAAKDAGLPLEVPDVSDADVAAGHAFALSVMSLGRELVEDWRGVVAEAGAAVPFAAALLPKVLSHPVIAENFFAAVTAATDEVTAEGNG